MPNDYRADKTVLHPAKVLTLTRLESDREHIAMPICQFSLEPISDLNALAAQWTKLEESAKPSLFLSWGWVGTWLQNLPADVAPLLLVARAEERVVGLAVVNRHDQIRYGWLKSRGLYLHETGNKGLDTLTVEYNGILVEPDYAAGILTYALEFLGSRLLEWDEFFLSGLPENDLSTVELTGTSQHLWDFKPCDHVDLNFVRNSGKPYLDHLSRNTRQQVRRALRSYEKIGPVEVKVASSENEALKFLDRLKELHQTYWNGRGEAGAFANPVFESFHREFIQKRFGVGEIEMISVTAGDASIGYLYNICHRKRIYSYQSGFSYDEDRALKPGLVSHFLAIERGLTRQNAIYDFMAGEGQHKRSLSTNRHNLAWISVRRNRFKYWVEDALRSLKNSVKG